MSQTTKKPEIYIVGYSLRLPESNTPFELHENLLNKKNMVTSDPRRWPIEYQGTPPHFGKIKQPLEQFDGLFFGIPGKQAEKLDPQLRLLLETSYEALVDAAISADEIKGSSMGVYTGSCTNDAYQIAMKKLHTITGYELMGASQSMFPNRLSYFYDLHGPSFNVDTACASSLTALHYAIRDLEQGVCDTAFVSGSTILLYPTVTTLFQNLQMLSPDGFCKTFDKSANGFTRAEGVITILLTSNPSYIRYAPYAKVLASSSNTCGYHSMGIAFPNHERQAALYSDILKRTHTVPTEINYIECHGTGTVAGDQEEILGIQSIFGDRETLKLGAFKSNIGHTEGASGLAGLTKVLLSLETKTRYPQLHLKDKLPAVGKLSLITEPESFDEAGKILINSFGFGGVNVCVCIEASSLHPHPPLEQPWHGLHFIHSRTKEGLYELKRELEKSPQQLPILRKTHYNWREVVGLTDDPQLDPIEKRPLYFAFSGNGSQWQGMGLTLMQHATVFRESLLQCGEDIPTLLLNGWSGPLQETMLLTALQIALIELLKSQGIEPDGFIAHSAGEIAASYASGATTLQETMAIAKARGAAAEEMPAGLMISVGLSQNDVLPYLTDLDKVCIACMNSPRNVTLSGQKEQITFLMQRFLDENIFVRALHTHERPYHSPLIDKQNTRTHLKKAYQRTIKRHASWISAIKDYTPSDFTVDYHIESVTRPVDFMGAMQHIPEHAIILEVGPHSVLRSLIRDCAPSAQYVPLMTKDADDFESFKSGLGRLWKLGVDIAITPDRVRPPLAVRAKQTAWKRELTPVSQIDYNAREYKHTYVLDLKEDDAYLLGHAIDHKPIFPAMGYVYFFWQSYLKTHSDCGIVTVDDFKIIRSLPLLGDQLTIDIISTANNDYQFIFGGELIAQARLGQKDTPASIAHISAMPPESRISQKMVYSLCANEGYTYFDEFQVIQEGFVPENNHYFYATIHFNRWISFLDGLLQVSILNKQKAGLYLPTAIRHIELSEHRSNDVIYNKYANTIQCGEIVIKGLEVMPFIKKPSPEHIIFQKEDYFFLGKNTCSSENDELTYVRNMISVVRQNVCTHTINLFDIGSGTGDFLKQLGTTLTPHDTIVCTDTTENKLTHDDVTQKLAIQYHHLDMNQDISEPIQSIISKADIVTAANGFHVNQEPQKILTHLYAYMKPGAFMFLVDATASENWITSFKTTGFQMISHLTNQQSYFFIRKPINTPYNKIDPPACTYNESWANTLKETPTPCIMHSKKPDGMAGFARALQKEGKPILSFLSPKPDQFIDEVKACGLVTNVVVNRQLATLCYTTQFPTTANITAPFHVEFNEPGHLDAFQFVKSKTKAGDLCKVEYAALNFRDVMLASGKIKKESIIGFSKHGSGMGMEFSGYNENQRIMGVGLDTIANYVHTPIYWPVPEDIDLMAAASIPVAYLTVYYSFFERANIKPGHKVLIHGGAGAVGQAAIRVALDVGCEVFTTCHHNKREILKQLFPQLDDAHIADSRSTQFEQQIMEQTQGKGVDILLNSLADDKLQASIHCLAQHGTFIEIGKYDLMQNTPIGLKPFLYNITFCGIDVDQIFSDQDVMKRLSVKLLDGLNRKVVQPTECTAFTWDQIPDALRYLGSGKHIGKVIIDMRDAAPQTIENRFYTTGAHLIIGGLGGVGMAVAEWLADRGATHLILSGRHGVSRGEQKLFMQRIQSNHPELQVDVTTIDFTHAKTAKTFFDTCPPLTGVYNLALVLNDTLFENMTKEKWEDTINPKAKITQHLDKYTRHHPLKQFVCFSSIATQGNPGQSNYAFANNMMESICYARHSKGLPGMAIQWGAIGNVGFVASQDEAALKILKSFCSLQSITSCLTYFEYCLLANNVVNVVHRYPENEQQTITIENGDMITTIGRILKIDLYSLPDTTTLFELGVDSLQAAEIQAQLSTFKQGLISIMELGKLSIGELKAMLDTIQVEEQNNDVNPTENDSPDALQLKTLMTQHGKDLLIEEVV